TSVGYKYNSAGQLQLESKQDMRRRGVPSPDEGDAVALCFSEPAGSPVIQAQLLWKDRLSPKELRLNSLPQTAWITTRRPNGPADTGESAAIHYVVADGVVKVTDPDGHMLRYADGEPCKQALGPDDNPKQIATRLGLRCHA